MGANSVGANGSTPSVSSVASVASCKNSEVEIISGLDCIHAFLVRGELPPAQRDALFRMVPQRFRQDVLLSKQWGLGAVICCGCWAEAQRHKATPPAGTLMQFKS